MFFRPTHYGRSSNPIVPIERNFAKQVASESSELTKQKFEILNVLEKSYRRSFSLSDLEKECGIPGLSNNQELLNDIRSNPRVDTKEDDEEIYFQWKKSFNFLGKDQFMTWLQENRKIVMTADIEDETYVGFKAHVEELASEKKVLRFKPAEKKKDEEEVIFYNDVYQMETEISEKVRKLWEETTSSDLHIQDVRMALTKQKVALADCKFENKPITIPIKKARERGKRKSREYHRKPNEILDSIELPEEFTLFGELDLESSSEKTETMSAVPTSSEEKAIAISKGKQTPQHILELIQRVIRTFYPDECVVVMDCIAQLGPTKDTKLAADLDLSDEQVRRAFVLLQKEHLIYSLEVKEDQSDRSRRKSGLWYFEFNEFVDIINYRILKMNSLVGDNKKEHIADRCLRCKQTFGAAEMMTIVMTQRCPNCQHPIEETHVPATQDKERRELQNLVITSLIPIRTMLAPLHNAEPPVATPTLVASSGPQLAPSARKTPVNKKRKTGPTTTAALKPILPGDTQDVNMTPAPAHSTGPLTISKPPVKEKNAPIVNPFMSMAALGAANAMANEPSGQGITLTKPITTSIILETCANANDLGPIQFYNKEHQYLIPLLNKSVRTYKWSPATIQAHKLLCLVGELKLYYSQVFNFTITPLSLFVAQTRDYSIDDIISYLQLLTRSLPQQEIARIRKISAEPYFKASITLRGGKYWVESPNDAIVRSLSLFASFPKSIREIPEILSVPATDPAPPIRNVFGFEIEATECEQVRRYGFENKIPVIDRFAYVTDVSCPTVKMNLRYPATRDYQVEASERMFWENEVHSGLLILPCGAGKTYCGVNISSKIKKNVVVFCTSTMAANQWKEQFEKWSTLTSRDISRFTSENKSEWQSNASVIISTYSMFSSSTARSAHSTTMINQCKARTWGLMILDEVHLAPADTFRKVTTEFKAHTKLGLTATMIREDGLIEDLPFLVGPKLFEVDLLSLRANRYIATIHCSEVKIPLTQKFKSVHSYSEAEKRKCLFITNPNKVLVANKLIAHHFSRGHKILIFSDDLFGLAWFSRVLKKEYIDGSTSNDDRIAILKKFRMSKGGDLVLLSKVGDISIDLPEANVLIQIGIVDGSRMQEAQRVGRIQRSVVHTETYFYSLISEGTSEEDYAVKRRKFMEEHGYRYEDKKFSDYVPLDQQIENIPFQQELLTAIDNHLASRRQTDEGGYSSLVLAQQKAQEKKSQKAGTAKSRLQKIVK